MSDTSLPSSQPVLERSAAPPPAGPAKRLVGGMLARAIAKRIPISGSIAMTHRCHLKCLHCYLGAERFSAPAGGERESRFWLSLVDQVVEAGCLNLLVTGGEPLLRADFAAVYEKARRRGLLVTVFTNGTLVDEPLADLLAGFPPVMVEISLYGASAEVYDAVTQARGAYARCLRGVELLLSRGVAVGLKTVILRENQHELAAMRRLASSLGVPFRLDPAVFPCRDGNASPLEHRVEAEAAVRLELDDPALLAKAVQYYDRVRALPPGDELFGCMAGLTSFHVDPQGILLPCLMVSSHGFDLVRGTFAQGWAEAMLRFRRQPIPEGYECHRCERRALCGLCPAQFALETGDIQRPSAYSCQLGTYRYRTIVAARPPASEASSRESSRD